MTPTGRPTALTAENAEHAEIALPAGAGLRPAFVALERSSASRRAVAPLGPHSETVNDAN